MIYEKDTQFPKADDASSLIEYFHRSVAEQSEPGEYPVRFAVTRTDGDTYHCEVGFLNLSDTAATPPQDSIFRFHRRAGTNAGRFNAVLMVPTGIGAEIGGHDGDAGALAKLMASACDTLITHPNVVNASDINELPENGLYVEGSVLCRLMMGTIGLEPVRANRILTVIDKHSEVAYIHAAVNAVSAARSSYGLSCPAVVVLDPPVHLEAHFSAAGRAVGRIAGLENLLAVIDEYRGQFDALAISSVIYVPYSYHMDYFNSKGTMVNPWGGVEAMLTHALSLMYDLPSAHAPMMESPVIEDLDPGIVDPRMAAEAISMTFIQSILKGLQRSPRIVTQPNAMRASHVIDAADVSCLIIPDGCLGLPTLAALYQGIPVIAVRENRNLMRNRLDELPWAGGQYHTVENYWEAVGVMQSLKAGIAPDSVRRPLAWTHVNTVETGVTALEES